MILGVLIPFAPGPLVTFALFGIAFALATPVIGALPAEVLEPRNRGPGFAATLNLVVIGGIADIGRRWGPMPM